MFLTQPPQPPQPMDMAQDATSRNPPAQRLVRCPSCGGDSVYAPSNPSRPFCSERCKNMDLGAWASEQFLVSTGATPGEYPHGD